MESQPNSQSDNINQYGKFGVGTNQGELNQFNSNNYGGTTNNIGTQINNNYPQTQEKPKQPPNNSPGNLANNFIGREKDLKALDKIIKNASQVAISAVAGMGGVGKSELAKQYISQHQETYPGGICWLNATEDNFISQLINLSGVEVNEKLTLVNQVQDCYKNWQWQGNVLLVFDDVQNYKHIKPFLPNQSRFKVLITTRKRLGKPVVRLDLDVLSPAAALDLLASFVEIPEAERETAKELCAWLGYLPLGLELVGRYLAEDEDLSVEEVLDSLKENSVYDEALVETAEEMSTELGIVAAIDLSWQQLKPQAQQLAYLLSLFALAPIPWELVENCLDTNQITKPKSAKKELTKLNLLKRVEKETYLFHSLIREFLHTKASQFDASQLKQIVCEIVAEKGREIPHDITLDEVAKFSPFISHLQEVVTQMPNYLKDEDLIEPFVRLESFYTGQGLYNLGEPWLLQGKEIALTRLGKNHPDTAGILNNLGLLYYSRGRYEKAETLYEKAIEINIISLPENHPSLALNLNNLAALYVAQGRYEEAEPLYEKAIEINIISLPENHPNLALNFNNLAELQHAQGRYKEAEILYEKAIEISKLTFRRNHPNFALYFNNLARLYYSQGKYQEAESFYKRVIEIAKMTLQENHPQLAMYLNNLSALYIAQGRYEEAEPLYKQAIEVNTMALGGNHPQLAFNFNNLALLYYYQSRYQEAELLFLRAIEIDKVTLAENHPQLGMYLNNLSVLYIAQERYEEAEPLYKQAIEVNTMALGENHPQFALNLNNLAQLYLIQGRYEEAEPLLKKAIEINKIVFLEKHPNSAISFNNLAGLYYSQGKYKEAEAWYLQALEVLLNSVGESHSDTKMVQENFDHLIYQVVREGREKELSNHPMVQSLIEEIKNN